MLSARLLTLGYADRQPILRDIDMTLAQGRITAVIGPNGCGKSTLLKAFARTLRPLSGRILYGDREIAAVPIRQFAREVAMLPQIPAVPTDLTVYDLVSLGRFPHQGMTGRPGRQDRQAVDWAMTAAGVGEMAHRQVMTLSGGERQRAFLAMALSRRPKVMLLDEPTTFLDISHQFEVLELVRSLNRHMGLTIAMVLHDINHAMTYADELVVVHDGGICGQGRPEDIMTGALCERVFGIRARFVSDNGRRIFYAAGRTEDGRNHTTWAL